MDEQSSFVPDEPEEEFKVVRTKKFPIRPMSVEGGHSPDESGGLHLLLPSATPTPTARSPWSTGATTAVTA